MSKRLTRDEALREAEACLRVMTKNRELFNSTAEDDQELLAYATAARAYIAYADSLVFGGPEDGGDDD